MPTCGGEEDENDNPNMVPALQLELLQIPTHLWTKFILFSVMCMCMHLCVSVCTRLQVSTEARDVRCPGAGVTENCETPNMPAGD